MEEKIELKYEEALTKLNQIVDKLERGDVPLDETIKYFETGQKLLKFCKDKLNQAEGKLFELTDSGTKEI